MIKQDIINHMDKLSDESKFVGNASNIYFPKTNEELVLLVSDFIDNKQSFTIQGGRTSITGSSCSLGENIINIENINSTIELKNNNENYTVLCDCGVRLSELQEYLNKNLPSHKFSPNPTEPTATISGLISTNAKGTNHIKYGSVSDKVKSLKVLLPNKKILTLTCDLPLKNDILPLEILNSLNDLEKENLYSGAIGINKNKGILQLFTGSEGILGVILQAELMLDKKIENQYGVFFFFKNDKAKDFCNDIKIYNENNDIGITSLEYFDKTSLDILKDYKEQTTKLKMLPPINDNFTSAVYIELEKDDMDELESGLFYLLELFANFGGEETDTWAGVGEEEINKFTVLRHSLPEAINIIVEKNKKSLPSLTKIACDFKLDNNFDELFNLYNEEIKKANIMGAVFGHILDCHLHVNLLPTTEEEVKTAYLLVDKFASFVKQNGGCLAFENGIGKLKKQLIKKYESTLYNNALIIKQYFDKDNLFNPNNIIGE